MNPDAPVSDIAAELRALGMDDKKVTSFMQRLDESMSQIPKPHTAQHLLPFTPAQVQAIESGAGWSSADGSLLRICLGSSSHPHIFQTTSPEPGANNITVLALSSEVKPESAFKVEGKGGILHEIAGRLQSRRDDITEYFPPSTFDEDVRWAPFRSNSRLRLKVVKEIEDMCGDLYPSKHERDVILRSIQAFCGTPDHSPSWDYYFTQTNKWDKKKHKGAAISDLEKARRDPRAYGCHGTAVEGQMRPARPARASAPSSALPQPPSTKVTEQKSEKENQMENTSNEDQKDAEKEEKDAEKEKKKNDDLADLREESSLLEEAEKLQKQVDAMRARAAHEKQRLKDAQKDAKADREAKAKAEREAAKANQKGPKRASQRGSQNGEGEAKKKKKKSEEAAPLSEYEKQRLATMEMNGQWLAFIEKSREAGCKILNEAQAREMLEVDAGDCEDRCALNSYLTLPNASHCVPLLPTASHCFPLLPTASYCFLLLPTASYCFPLLPAASYCFLLLPTARRVRPG